MVCDDAEEESGVREGGRGPSRSVCYSSAGLDIVPEERERALELEKPKFAVEFAIRRLELA